MFRNTNRKDINGLPKKVLACLLALLFVFSCVFGVAEETDDTANPTQDITETESAEQEPEDAEMVQDEPAETEEADAGETSEVVPEEETEAAPKYEGPYHLYFVYSDSTKNSYNNKKAQLAAQVAKYEKASLDIAHAMLKSGRADEVYIGKLFVDAGRYVKCLEEEAICKFWEQKFLRVQDAIAKNLNDSITEFSDDETAIVIIFFGDEFSGIADDEKWNVLENNENIYFIAEGESKCELLNSRKFSIEEIEEELYGDYYDASEYNCIYDKDDVANNHMPECLLWNDAADEVSLVEEPYFQHVIISKGGEMLTLRVGSDPVSVKSREITRIWASEDKDHKTIKQIFDENVALIRDSMWILADDEQDCFKIFNVPQIDGIRVDYVSKHVIDGNEQEPAVVTDDVTVYVEPVEEIEEVSAETEQVISGAEDEDAIASDPVNEVADGADAEDEAPADESEQLIDEEAETTEEAATENEEDEAPDEDAAEETAEEIEAEDGRQDDVVLCYAPVARGDWYLDVCITNDEDQLTDDPRFDGLSEYITIANHIPALKEDVPYEVDFGFYVALDSTSEIGSALGISDYFEDLDGDELFWLVDGKKTDSPLYGEKYDGEIGKKVHELKAIDCADGTGETGVKVTYRMDDILGLFAGEAVTYNRNGEDEIHKGDELNVSLKLKDIEELPDYVNWNAVEEYLSGEAVVVEHRDETVPMAYDAENRMLNCVLVTDAVKSGEGAYKIVIGDEKREIPVEGNNYQIVNVPLSIISGETDGQGAEISDMRDDIKPDEDVLFTIPLSNYISGEENDILSLKAEWNGTEIAVKMDAGESGTDEAKQVKNCDVSWDGKENVEVRFSGMKFFCSDKDTLKLIVTDQDGSSAELTAEYTLITMSRKYLPYAIGVVIAIIAAIVFLCIRINHGKGLILDVQYMTINNVCVNGKAKDTAEWHGHKLSLYQIVLLTNPMLPVPVDVLDAFRKTFVKRKKKGTAIKVCSVGKSLTRENADDDAVVFVTYDGAKIQLKPLGSSGNTKTL